MYDLRDSNSPNGLALDEDIMFIIRLQLSFVIAARSLTVPYIYNVVEQRKIKTKAENKRLTRSERIRVQFPILWQRQLLRLSIRSVARKFRLERQQRSKFRCEEVFL